MVTIWEARDGRPVPHVIDGAASASVHEIIEEDILGNHYKVGEFAIISTRSKRANEKINELQYRGIKVAQITPDCRGRLNGKKDNGIVPARPMTLRNRNYRNPPVQKTFRTFIVNESANASNRYPADSTRKA